MRKNVNFHILYVLILQAKMVELLASKCSTWKHHPSRTTLDSRTPFPLGQPVRVL